MTRLYAAHSGNLDVFTQSTDRLLCTEDAGTGVVRASGATANPKLCTTTPAQISRSSADLGLGDMYYEETTAPPFKTRDLPRLQVAASKRLVQRFATGDHAVQTLLLPIVFNGKGSQLHYPASVCIKDVAASKVVFRTVLNVTMLNITANGWTRIMLPAALPAHATFDVALTNAIVPDHRKGDATPDAATWLTQTAVTGGGGRIETWGYIHAGANGASKDDNSCCAQDWSPPAAAAAALAVPSPFPAAAADRKDPRAAHAPTLASRLEAGMAWQLGLATATRAQPPQAAGPSSSRSQGRFGILVVPDAFHNGVPITGMATCSASSMWDQIRMGWKSMYINVLFLASLDAWIELEDAGAVRSLESLVGLPAVDVRTQVADDIDAQFGYDTVQEANGQDGGRGFLSWISCNTTSSDGALSRCPRDAPSGGGQRPMDTQMMPDQAWAVKLGVGGAKARTRLDAMLRIARTNGLVMNNLVPQESIDPRIVSSADKWDPVTKHHFCDPARNGRMVYAGHCVCATDATSRLPKGEGAQCYSNFRMNQQNGGKVFATQSTVFESGPYNGSFDDFRINVANLRTLVAQLRSGDRSATPLLNEARGYIRTRIPGGGALRTMCLIENSGSLKKGDVNGSTLDKDPWGEDICNYNKDITFGLRTGPRGVLIGFAVGHLGLHVGANGTLLLYRQPVAAKAATMDVRLPEEVAERWPAELKGVHVGGLRVGSSRVDVACNVTMAASSGTNGTSGSAANPILLQCEFEWGAAAG
jgi:hypothetical protein